MAVGQDSKGGRFGRTPFKPDELEDEYEQTDSGHLDITCPGCGRDWYPTSKCCVSRYAGDPFCPDCGTDFRQDATKDLQRRVQLKDKVVAATRTSATSKIHNGKEAEAKEELEGVIEQLEEVTTELASSEPTNPLDELSLKRNVLLLLMFISGCALSAASAGLYANGAPAWLIAVVAAPVVTVALLYAAAIALDMKNDN